MEKTQGWPNSTANLVGHSNGIRDGHMYVPVHEESTMKFLPQLFGGGNNF